MRGFGSMVAGEERTQLWVVLEEGARQETAASRMEDAMEEWAP